MATHSLLTRALVFYGCRLPNHPGKWWLHSRLRRLFGVAPHGEAVVVRQGLHWSLDPSDFQHADLFWLGTNDHWDAYHARRLVTPGAVVLDVGANFGYYALTLAMHLPRQCPVHAFEPNPPTFAPL